MDKNIMLLHRSIDTTYSVINLLSRTCQELREINRKNSETNLSNVITSIDASVEQLRLVVNTLHMV